MFRRVELIHHFQRPEGINHFKWGIMGIAPEGVIDAWIDHLRGPKHPPRLNAKYYFTEKGWKEIGRKVVRECQKAGQEYRVIAIKETDAQVVWKDKYTGYEVAIQPKRKRS